MFFDKAEKTVLNIEGMTCSHCVKAVTEALLAVDGVKAAKVSLEKKCAEVKHGDKVSSDALNAAVTEAGFHVA
ncbi:MAG: copper ion binding protein [Treponemataceae bacterium]|nr:MAG: copper ion binding protein [Treponemataceae bacterium]